MIIKKYEKRLVLGMIVMVFIIIDHFLLIAILENPIYISWSFFGFDIGSLIIDITLVSTLLLQGVLILWILRDDVKNEKKK